jgi:paraquat-inducible protein A
MRHADSHVTCHHCGAQFRRVRVEKDHVALCSRCDSVLETYSGLKADGWSAIAITALITFVLANAYPIGTLLFQGTGRSATFLDTVKVAWDAGFTWVALLTGATGFALPALHLFLLLWILIPLSLGRIAPAFEKIVTIIDKLTPWCMVPVFLLGALVAIVKLVDLATLKLGVGLYATVATAIFITGLSRLNGQKLRNMAQDRGLNVSDAPIHAAPSPKLINRTWALLATAIILYIPANLLPIMHVHAINGSSGHTIMGGVIELWQTGAWDIALVVFIASVFVPMLKLFALSVLVWLAQKRSALNLKARTRIYTMVEFIGQWSMLDVFVVILLAALGKFGNLLDIAPGSGAAAFGAVVVLTMIAAMGFDPRLSWRLAGHRRHLKPTSSVAHSNTEFQS